MSQEEHDYMLRLIRGEDSLMEGDPPTLDVTATIYFELAVLNDKLRPQLRAEIGSDFDDLVRKRLRTLIPVLLEKLRNAEMLAAIENDLGLIVRGCELFGIDVAEFIPRDELLPLARTAYVRSAEAFKKQFGMQQPAKLFFACAAGMGITAEEMGLDPAFLEDCIDTQLHRNSTNPQLATTWGYYLEQRRYFEETLA